MLGWMRRITNKQTHKRSNKSDTSIQKYHREKTEVEHAYYDAEGKGHSEKNVTCNVTRKKERSAEDRMERYAQKGHKNHIQWPPTGRQMAILPMPISQQPFNGS